MIEVSITEIALFAWGMLATAMALHFHHKTYHLTRIMYEILSNQDVREKAIQSWRDFETSTLKGNK
jgi:hypothetical protein